MSEGKQVNIASKIAAHSIEAQAGWGSAYGKFAHRIEERGLRIGVEIGVAFGGHAESILMETSVEKLYGVDPYRHLVGYHDPMNLPQEEFDELFKFTLARLARFGNRYEHIREISKNAATQIGDVDFAYIDADHSYMGVWNDLRLWFPKVRPGGVIGGHDYDHPNFAGVRGAIDEFLSHFSLRATHDGDGVWWVEKQGLTQAQQCILATLRPSGMPVEEHLGILARIIRKAGRMLRLR
jgi:hypothetical protein